MRRAIALGTVLLLALGASTALARVTGKQRIQRVQKGRPIEEIHLYWASMNSDVDVLVTRFPGGTKEGEEFEIIDQRGYLGRARVHHVDKVQGSCPSATFDNAYAQLQSRPAGGMSGTLMVALPPSRRDLSNARVMLGEEVRSPPRLEQNRYIDLALDLDGDNDADLVRVSYECPPKTPQAGYSYGYCMDIQARDRKSGWKLLETVVIMECY